MVSKVLYRPAEVTRPHARHYPVGMAFDPDIPRFQTVVLQRLLDAVTQGYRHHTGGLVPAEKASALAEKFHSLYGVGATRNQRAYRKTQGQANARLLLYPVTDEAPGFRWWLLATPGGGPVHERERLKDATQAGERLTWGDRFELVHQPRPGISARWTWRMTREEFQAWHERIRIAVRHRESDDLVQQLIWSLYRVPGFGGLRDQVKQLSRQLAKEWQRSRRASAPMPELPGFIGYVRRTTCEAFPLSLVQDRLLKGMRPFPNRSASAGEDDTEHSDGP